MKIYVSRLNISSLFLTEMENDNGSHLHALYVSYIVAIVLTVALVVSAMVLLVGTMKVSDHDLSS